MGNGAPRNTGIDKAEGEFIVTLTLMTVWGEKTICR